MKSWGIEKHQALERLSLVDQPIPEPSPGEVLIRVRAVSLNYRDLLNVENQRPGNLPPPLVPCSDGAGDVVAVGAGVTRWKVGDRVAGSFFRDWICSHFHHKYHGAAAGGSIHGWL